MKLDMYTFGSERPKTIEVGTCKVILVDSKSKEKELEVCIVPTILHKNGIRTVYDSDLIASLRQRYKLADRCFTDNRPLQMNIDILIGSDYYSSFIQGSPIKVDEGLHLTQSSFGYLLNGKSSVPRT